MSSKRKQAETKYNHYEEYQSSSKKVYMAFYEDKTQYKQTGSLLATIVYLHIYSQRFKSSLDHANIE